MRLAVVGLGLIGGSIGLAARGRAGASVCGYDPDQRARETALEMGAIDSAAEDLPGAVHDAEVVFVAAPVGALPEAVTATLAAAGPDCAVSDVGSTKAGLLAATHDRRFVGGHPLAGGERGGIAYARADLFDDAPWYLTPTAGVTPSLLARLRETIAALGARPHAIDAQAHDRLMASLSHLPHVLANVLAHGAAAALDRERDQPSLQAGSVAGPSFRDATRVAGANTAIWTDIYLSNREALTVAIDDAIVQLQAVRQALSAADAGALAGWNDLARAERERVMGQAS